MDFEEVVLKSKKSSETGQMEDDKPVRGKFSKTVIGEDLRRAIVALRSVPKVNWSEDSVYEDCNDGHATTEYIWRATDLSPGSSSFAADWQAAMKLNDCNQRTFLTNNGAPLKMAVSQTQNQSEIMRKDSFTVASKRLDRTSDSKCQLVEQSTTSVQMSLFSREKRGKANGIGERSSMPTPSELAASPAGAVVKRKPPPLPPKPSHLQNFNIKQQVTGKLALDGVRISGGAKDLRKAGISLNGTNLDVADIYERSLDVLEKDDSDQDFEDLTSPRSDSPECLLEELLDSVPAVEFDTLECHTTPSAYIPNNGGTVKTNLSFDDKLEHKLKGAEKEDAEEMQNKEKKGCEPKVNLTTSAKTESSSRINPFRNQRNNNPSLKPFYIHTKPVPKQLDFNAMKKTRSTLAPEYLNVSSVTVASDKELTPEDIFEEIMDLMETRKQEQRDKSNVQLPLSSDNNRDEKHLEHEPNRLSACDYLLENEWLSIYCDQIEADIQHEIITKSTISERTTEAVANTTNSESLKSSKGEAVLKCKEISEPFPGPTTTLLLPDGEALQGPSSRLLSQPDGKLLEGPHTGLRSPDGKALQGQNTIFLSSGGKVLQGPYTILLSPGGRVLQSPNTGLPSPGGKVLQDPSTIFLSSGGKVLQGLNTGLPSPDGKALQGKNTTLSSPDGTATVTSQDTLQATVKRKPIPPLRETVQTYTFTKKDSLTQDIKIAPTIKSQPLTQRKDPKILSNGFPVSNSSNCRAELKYEPVKVVNENSENRRTADASSSAASNVAPCERINNTESLFSRDDSISLPTDRIVPIITRESEWPGCDMYEEDMDLDLEIELSRNLDACTASDVECQSIDKLVTSESLLSSDTTVIRRPKKSNSLEVRVPGKLGEILAKKKLKKSQSIENTGEVVWPHRNETVNSRQVNIEENTTISTLGKGNDTAQEASHTLRVKDSPEFSDNRLKELTNFETTRKVSPGYSKESELFKYEASLDESLINKETEKAVVADSSSSDNEDNYKQTMIRNVRSVEKENKTELEKRQSIQVLSEEVTSQEIVLKIAWPKQQSKGQSKIITEMRKPPFRELQLKRVQRISDLDNPLNVFPKVDTSQPVLAVTQQSPNSLSPGVMPLSVLQPNDARGVTPPELKSRVGQTVATRKNISEIAVEYVKQKNCRKLEHISDSAIDVHQTDTVKVLRVPMAAVHKVEDIKVAVAAVGSTILEDLQRQPKKRNIRVTCEAVESKSRASLHDQDVTVIRNTIVDTYGPKPAIGFSSGPTNSVQI